LSLSRERNFDKSEFDKFI